MNKNEIKKKKIKNNKKKMEVKLWVSGFKKIRKILIVANLDANVW